MQSRKYPISEEHFKTFLEPIILENRKKSGRPTKISHYQFFCAILYVMRTGISWRDLPELFGNWHTIYMRFKRWSASGLFWNLLYLLQQQKKITLNVIFVDSSAIPLHRHGGGALKKTESKQ